MHLIFPMYATICLSHPYLDINKEEYYKK
jgi:hypothetical protein